MYTVIQEFLYAFSFHKRMRLNARKFISNKRDWETASMLTKTRWTENFVNGNLLINETSQATIYYH